MKRVSRVAIYLCVLIALSEFGPAHFRRLHAEKRALSKKEQHKRGWTGAVATLGKYIFKVVELSAKYFSDISSVVALVSTIYDVVNKCENTEYGAEAKQYTDQAKKITEKINAGSQRINALQLETENLQIQIETLNYHFNQTLDEMEEAGYLSQRLLEIINPDVVGALDNATIDLQKQITAAENIEKPVDYATVSKTYVKRIDKVVNIAVPVISLLIPRIPKIIKFGKTRMETFKSLKLVEKFPSIKLPSINTKPFKAFSSWFAKPKAFISAAKNKLRGKLKTTYEKAAKYVEKFGKAFGVLSNLVFAAYNIYTIVSNFGQKQCMQTRDESKKALDKLKEAEANYDEVLANATSAKEEMIRIKDEVVAQISNETFIEDLKSMKTNMEDIQGDGNGMQDMIDATDAYIQNIPGNDKIGEVGSLMQNLYENAIGTLPFIYRCLNDRVALIGFVAGECKTGKRTLEEAIQAGRTLFNLEIETCNKRTGIPYFSDEELQRMINQASVDQGFNKECKLNDKFTTQSICSAKCVPKDANKISTDLGLPLDAVNEILKDCPDCEITDNFKAAICDMIQKGQSPEQVQSIFKQFTVEQINALSC
ncbi:uncharacterized protein LOC110240100 [Exaiptasia diaphana]|uniref:Uncharacterized protein n=1 Tax=Exaiptasia diaphana TaxID=2652724 RepID=A0A913XAF6_EXADI|nr:uncharacterized protein LOC110240100 [Exaiptasia diaphana]